MEKGEIENVKKNAKPISPYRRRAGKGVRAEEKKTRISICRVVKTMKSCRRCGENCPSVHYYTYEEERLERRFQKIKYAKEKKKKGRRDDERVFSRVHHF